MGIIRSFTDFSGGISPDSKRGLPGSCRFSQNLNIYEDSSYVSLSPTPIKNSGEIVAALVKWMADGTPYDSYRYAYDDVGNIYKINGDTWSVDRSGAAIGNGAAGQGLIVFDNYLYYPTATTLGRKGLLSGTPSFSDDFLSNGTDNLDISLTGSGNSYTLPTSISETAANKITFTPSYDPVKSAEFNIVSVGTGNWTLTLHDSLNNTIASATVLNAALSAGNHEFVFSNAARVLIGASYHLHLTSTVADGTVGTGTSSDLSTAYLKTYFGILISDTAYHPIIQHTNGAKGTIVIGNDRYLAEFDGDTYNPNRITLEPGFKVRGITKVNEFIAAYCWKGNNIDDTEVGRIYYWNGQSNYFDFYDDITAGLPNAITNSKNRLLAIVGSRGHLAMGNMNSVMGIVQPAPGLSRGKRVEVMPGAITNWQTRTLFGYGNSDDGSGIKQGVYEFGSDSDRALSEGAVSQEVLNFAFSPSSQIENPTSFAIGCVAAFGKDLYFSVKDGDTYYVDKVSKTNGPASFGSWESLIIDEGVDKYGNVKSMPGKDKLALRLVITYETLPEGATITPKYKINRAASFTTASVPGQPGSTKTEILFNSLGAARYREIEIGFDVTAGSEYPVITGVYFEYDPLQNEEVSSL